MIEKAKRTYAGMVQLEKEAAKLSDIYSIGSAFSCILSAQGNAADTCTENGIRPEHEKYNAALAEFFWASLEAVITFPETKTSARRWFEHRGIIG